MKNMNKFLIGMIAIFLFSLSFISAAYSIGNIPNAQVVSVNKSQTINNNIYQINQTNNITQTGTSYNASYDAGIKWFYNQTYIDGTYNATYDEYAYNQTYVDGTYNVSYDGLIKWDYNQSQFIIDTYGKWFYNMTSQGDYNYNQTYTDGTYNATYDEYAYNQTYIDGTYNATYNTWAYNQTTILNETEFELNDGIWTIIKTWLDSYLDNWFGAKDIPSYNATYDEYAYNQTGNYQYNQTYTGGTYNTTYVPYNGATSNLNMTLKNITRIDNLDLNVINYRNSSGSVMWKTYYNGSALITEAV